MEPRSGELLLETERTLPESPAEVFTAFTDPSELEKWWGPAGFTIPELRYRAQVGEQYRIEMRPPDGDSFHLRGEFRAVEPPIRLVYTFEWEEPDPDDVETLVTLSFRDLAGSTQVTLRQEGFKTEARLDLHRNGWAESFDRLEQMLSARA